MKKYALLLAAILALVGCTQSIAPAPDPPPKSSAKELTAYAIGANAGVFTGTAITVNIPAVGTSPTALVATYTTTGMAVAVAGIAQVSSVTPNNFSAPVTYTVSAADGTTAQYIVTVLIAQSSPIPPPAGLAGPVKAAFYDGANVNFYDGVNTVLWKSGAAVKANGFNIAVGNILYSLDASGATIAEGILPSASTSAIIVVPKAGSGARDVMPISVGSDVWSFVPVTADELIGNGDPVALKCSHIYKNGIAQCEPPLSMWYFGWIEKAVISGCGDFILTDQNGNLTDYTNPNRKIVAYFENGPLWWQNTVADPGIVCSTANGTFTTLNCGAYFYPMASSWWQQGSTWYNSCGASWSETGGWTNEANKLTEFYRQPYPAFMYLSNGAFPWLIYMGDYLGLSYLVDSQTGWLIAVDTGSGNWTHVMQLFIGETGDTNKSYFRRATLQPSVTAGYVYWHYNSTLWRMDFASKTVASYSVDQQIWIIAP